jgi:hypothetical protein
MKHSAAILDDDELQIAKDGMAVQMDPTAIQFLLYRRNGILLSKPGISYIKAIENNTIWSETEQVQISAAEALLSYLKQREDISFFAVYDDPTSELITIPKRRQCMAKQTVTHTNGKAQEMAEAINVVMMLLQIQPKKEKI